MHTTFLEIRWCHDNAYVCFRTPFLSSEGTNLPTTFEAAIAHINTRTSSLVLEFHVNIR
jgi:hypothetical protein